MDGARPPRIAVVGSVNLDIVAAAPRLPVAGETISGAVLNRYPGGKGANQALAARRLGAEVALFAGVAEDASADEALALLREGGVDLSGCEAIADTHTGVALIAVAPSGENQIVVAPGANRHFAPAALDLSGFDALICQLEVPIETVAAAAGAFEGFFCLNLAPAARVPDEILRRVDLLVMNDTEAAFIGEAATACRGMIALTHGASGAEIRKDGKLLAKALPPRIEPVDTTGAGDTFTAALTVALVEGRPVEGALTFACAAGAAAATKAGAQPSFPTRAEVLALLAAR